ncbi:predicted protein [Uncinocarpus reesii 1704]|uniref:Uncharacterized protein n=1 Tax=Uncinocarpus reesii (strain UAMH 1704) TaxID=336963 RepID=C4JRU7_UNCRE|nr:uncharacterized protein UREG_05186 [Uncinocarpus reesii 1704]EEP80344.1 predicted protein [Uncinocarpus reesii 1704]
MKFFTTFFIAFLGYAASPFTLIYFNFMLMPLNAASLSATPWLFHAGIKLVTEAPDVSPTTESHALPASDLSFTTLLNPADGASAAASKLELRSSEKLRNIPKLS